MKIKKEELPIFVIYVVVFAYALLIQFTAMNLPLSAIAMPTALVLLVVFILHVANILLRGKE